MKIKTKKIIVFLCLLTFTAFALAPAITSAASGGIGDYGKFNPNQEGGLPKANDGILGIIRNIMKWLLTAVGFLGVIGFAYAGILYLTAGGEEGRIKTAKSAMLWSAVGVVVAIAGVVILNAAKAFLEGTQF
jgi:hypothetical protein